MKKRKILIFGNGPSAEVVYRILKKIENLSLLVSQSIKNLSTKKSLVIQFLILNTW